MTTGARGPFFLIATVLTALATGRPARADEPPIPDGTRAPSEGTGTEATPEESGLWDQYTDYWDRKLEEIIEMDLYGVSAQLPKGVFKAKLDWNPVRANSRYNARGRTTPIIEPISFTEFTEIGGQSFDLLIDPRVKGGGAGFTFQFSYGLTGRLDPYIEIPFIRLATQMRLRLATNPRDDLVEAVARAQFPEFLRANGRPMPGDGKRGARRVDDYPEPYNVDFSTGGLDLGDINLGVSWNYHRTPIFSAAMTPRIFLPTGRRAAAGNDISFLLGPEIDRGLGAWGLGVTHGFDVRPPDPVKWVTFSAELTVSYYFPYERPAPDWLPITDCARVADAARRAELGCTEDTPYDRAIDLENGQIFPDLTGLADHYKVSPGAGMNLQLSLTIDPIPIPVQLVYQFRHSEAPEIRASGTDGSGQAFKQLIKTFELLEVQESHVIGVGITLPLFPLYVPANIMLGAKWQVGGKNSLKLKDNYNVTTELFIPFGDLFGDDDGDDGDDEDGE